MLSVDCCDVVLLMCTCALLGVIINLAILESN